MTAVNITSLNRELVNYQRDFLVLPYAMLIPFLQEMKISMLEVANKDVVIVKERRGGLVRPYVVGGNNKTLIGEISKMRERSLTTEFAYCSIQDNVLNYKQKQVLYDATKGNVDNKTKKHPFERDIIADQVITFAEDVIDAIWHSTRDTADQTPMGMCDGINTKIDADIVAGEISEAKGNLVACAALSAPVNGDYLAYTRLRDWLRNTDAKIKNKDLVLYITPSEITNVKDALENKKSGFKDITFEQVLAHLRDDCQLPKLQIVSHYAYGTGSRKILTTPGNIDIGMNTFSDLSFIQIRNPWADPNLVQFWMQFEVGTRLKNNHKRGFMVSDGANVSNEMSGDYVPVGSSESYVGV